jgi:hypothetical protein
MESSRGEEGGKRLLKRAIGEEDMLVDPKEGGWISGEIQNKPLTAKSKKKNHFSRLIYFYSLVSITLKEDDYLEISYICVHLKNSDIKAWAGLIWEETDIGDKLFQVTSSVPFSI